MHSFLPALVLAFVPAVQLSPAAFSAKVERLMAGSGAPGAALEVVREGEVIFRQAWGLADVERGTPYTPALAFEIGSVSKQFTAACLLRLAEAGKLTLADPLGKHLADLPEAWRSIRIADVMHHLSGIPDYEAIAGYDYYNEPHRPEEVLAVAATHAPDFAPGTRFHYSNTGYYLLSLVVERVSGQPFGTYLHEQLFEPLGMGSTRAGSDAPVARATGHRVREGKQIAVPPIAWTSTYGAGGIVSTFADLGRWDAALDGEQIASRAWLSKLWEPGKTTDGATVNYGAGWFLERIRGVEAQSHSGGTNGFCCYYLRFPGEHLTVFVQTNSYSSDPGAVAMAAAVHFHPALNYAFLPLAEDEEPDRTAEHREALGQAILAAGELDLLAGGMQTFAREPRYAEQRKTLEPVLTSETAFDFVRRTEGTDDSEEFLYRSTHAGGEFYWTLRFRDGLLTSLDWTDE